MPTYYFHLQFTWNFLKAIFLKLDSEYLSIINFLIYCIKRKTRIIQSNLEQN